MLDIFSTILAVIYILSLYSLYIYNEKFKGKHGELLSGIFLLIATPFCAFFFWYNYAFRPFSQPTVTSGIITGTFYAPHNNGGNTYEYLVGGRKYEGIVRYSDYVAGDTLAIIYDWNDPASSRAAYKLYWYINPSMKKYWRIHDRRFHTSWP